MSKSARMLILVLFIIVCYGVSTQIHAQEARHSDTRVPLRLLPGYKFKSGPVLEGGSFGAISKVDGPTIDFEVNPYATVAVDSIPKNQLLWREEQFVGKNHFVCVYTRADEIVITVPGPYLANFRAKIHSQKDLADVLLMVLTFDPTNGYPIDPSAIVN
jgi:hypothetical protein